MDAFIKAKDAEIVKLLADNHDLSEELRQCQADKEFVWSLWKRLQVSSPDLTQAISLVMQREKEKCEAKDRKVLEILQSKDEQIENLQETVTSLKKELDKVVQMKSTLEGTRTMLTTENEDIKRNNDILNERVAKMEALGRDEAVGLKKSLENMKEQRDELNDKVTKLLIDLQTSRMGAQTLDVENDKLRKKAKRIEEENQELSLKNQKLQREREALSEEVINLKRDLSHYRDGEDTARRELDSNKQSNQEIKQSYQQLKTHSAEQKSVILQLQSLNNDAQAVLKEQEKSYKEELNKNRKIYSELARKYESLQKAHHSLEKAYGENEHQLGFLDLQEKETNMATGSCRRLEKSLGEIDDLEIHIASQQEEIDLLRRRLKEKNLQLIDAKNNEYSPIRVKNRYSMPENTFSPIIERIGRQKPVQNQGIRSRSFSPNGRQVALINRRLQATDEKLNSTRRLLELKKDELKQLQKAHDKRLGRLKEVQSQYRELRETLQEKDIISPRKSRNKKKTKRPNSVDMRQENCDAVWNELAYYKRENRNILNEKLSLEEDLDNLRVQAAMDKATVQELNMCLKQEKDDLMTKLKHNTNRLSSTPKKQAMSQEDNESRTSVTSLRHMVKNLERKLENSTEDTKLLKKERNQLLKELKFLKEGNKALKRDVTESKQSSAKLRQDVVEFRHKLENAEDKTFQAEIQAKDSDREAAKARSQNLEGREENNNLRVENNQLRAELSDLQDELREITHSLEVADINKLTQLPKSGRSVVPSLTARSTSTKLSSDSARKHQKFLSKSISNMREAFGKNKHDPTSTTENTTVDTDMNDSDGDSLGERIVRAAGSVPGLENVNSDDDDTLVDDKDIKSVRSKSAPSKTRVKYGGGNDLQSLKQRLAAMQNQCSTLITERQTALREVGEVKDRNSLLESELQGVQNRLKSAKASIQKLHREVEVISREKEEMQRALESVKNSMPEVQKYSDTDYRLLENKLRMANADAHHYMEQMKKNQKENEEKLDSLAGLKEKVARLERDVTMKRQLIEEQRAKLKSAEQSNQSEQQAMLDMEARVKQLSDELSNKKNYVDSLKRQVQAVGRDKARYEQSYNDAKANLDKKCEQISVEQARKLEAENLATQLESTVEQQLNSLASKSEQALEKLQSQLTVTQERNKEYSTCIQILSNQILEVLSHQRNSIHQHKEQARQEAQIMRESDPSMNRAQSIACSILNMSKADFEELMTPVDSRKRVDGETKKSDDMKVDREWKLKVDEIARETPPFAKSLNRLLWDKIQDAIHLAEEKCRVQYEIASASEKT